MILKTPIMLDTSKWEEVADFAKVSPRPMMVITKATEGSTYTDPSFAKYWKDLKQDGIFRGAFHFHRKAFNANGQAAVFLNALKANGVDAKDIFVLDVEEEGTSATQIIAWLDLVETQYGNMIWIYSRANILNPISMTDAQRQRLKKYPIWTAGYPTNPDTYNTVPAAYIPNQNNWGAVWAWQYSDKGVVSGISGNVDVNWMSLELLEYLNPVDDEFKITQDDWNTMLLKLDLIRNAIEALDISGGTEPDPDPEPEPEPDPMPVNDGYIGPSMGIYRVIEAPDQQAGTTLTIIQDSYGNEVTIIMDAMVAWMVANCPGWSNFVKTGAVVKGADGFWRYEVKIIKGQLLRIAEVGGKTGKNPLGNGRIVGMDSEGDPTHGAVNMAVVSPTLTPHYFHKIPSVPRYYPIVQPRQQKQMTVLNAWWIPMRWLEKVS